MDNYSNEFQRIKTLKEKRRLDFSSKNEEEYNLPFSVTELRQSLQRANDSATGLDQVHYQLLTHLPNSALSVLLKVYNYVWESGCFLPSWCEAVVIPIPKPDKDHLDPGNFRPITLTSCLCKTMERMINAHLMWSLESQGLLSEKQCGFRKNSTLDHLIYFETFIRNAVIKKHVLTIFFDLEKAYDTHGSTAFWRTSGLSVSGATSPGLFRASCQNILSGLKWVPLFLSCTNRRWGSCKVASCLWPFSALKLTTLLKLS